MPRPDSNLTWGRSVVETACPLDCPDACSLAITLEKGRVVKIDGTTRQAVTNGYICAKVRRFGDRVYGESRLRHPGVRKGAKGSGSFSRVSWNEALDAIATRMRDIRDRWGAEAILPFSYGGSNGLLTQDTTDAFLFRRFATSRLARTVCAAPTGAANLALYGKMPSITYADYPHARLIVLWGVNPSTSGIHLVPYVREAQRSGAKLVVVDPRRTPLARQADLHLAVRPGTDLVVALSIIRHFFENGLAAEAFLAEHAHGADRLRERAAEWTFERAAAIAGLDASQIQAFAGLYAGSSPALIRCGWGLERNRNGGSAAMAVLALPAVAGKFGVRGGGYSLSNSAAWGFNSQDWIGADEPQTRVVNMNHLGRALTEYDTPPVKMLFVYNCNPVATMPDQNRVLRGLAREDLFTVVFDQVRTDTVAYADVVLPATTFLEHYDLARSYGPISLQLARPVIDAFGESRSNADVFGDLSHRLCLNGGEPGLNEPETLLRVLETMPEEAREGPLDGGVAEPPYGAAPVQFVDVFPRTPDRKIDLFPATLEKASAQGPYVYQGDPSTERFPLALISPASDRTVSSTLGELRDRPAAVVIHPDDATPRGIEDGDSVRLFNELGEVHCHARVADEVRPGTISLSKGLWRKSTANRSTSNALVSDALTDIGAGACFNDARVEVAKSLTAALSDRNVTLWVDARH